MNDPNPPDGCIFCDIAAGRADAYIFWQDADHLAFLSHAPNTPDFSVVIPRQHLTSDVFDQTPSDVAA